MDLGEQEIFSLSSVFSFPNILTFTLCMHLSLKLVENYLIIFHNHRQFGLKLPNTILICKEMLVLTYFDGSTLRFTKTNTFISSNESNLPQ